MPFPRTIIGLGTGRCGTWSLTRLFEGQPDVYAFHEGGFLPWKEDKVEMWRLLHRFWNLTVCKKHSKSITAAVSFFWLNYVSEIMSYIFDPKFICLKRDRTETVASFEAIMPKFNFWTDPDSKHWDDNYETNKDTALFPKYDKPRHEAIEAYCNYYYNTAGYWQNKLPQNFKIFSTEDLNTEKGVRAILEFAEIKNPVIHVGVRLNTRAHPRGNIV